MKKLFPEEKDSKKRIKEFLDKKGFYIVLLLCIAIVAGTAVFFTTRDATSTKSNYDAQKIIPEDSDKNSAADAGAGLNAQAPIGTAASSPDQVLAANEPAKATPKGNEVKPTVPQKDNKGTPKSNSTVTPAKSTTVKSSSTAKSTTGAAKAQKFIMPVFGDITFEYAEDKLVYSKTLEEWRTHSGVDLASDRGTPVKAVADGVVSEIKNDPRFGIIVIVDHQNGLKTVYSNLAADDMVTTNQKVKQGEILGSVGNTAAFESAEQSHLHFEVLKNNESVDPSAYLPEKQANQN